jgi:dienelactone hydrolase
VQVVAVADTARAARRLPATGGVDVANVIAGGGAEAAKLRAGDVIVSLGGTEVATPQAFAQAAAGRKVGEKLPIVYYRDGRKRTVEVALKPMPLESDPRWETIYGSVDSQGGRLRTVMTVPPQPGRHPAFMIIQGIGTFSTEFPPAGIAAYQAIVQDFATRGWVTLRVDKPGCGDSQGGPLRDVDFDTQLDGFRQALLLLRADPRVDPERIVVFGHSMGGWWGPLLSQEVPLRGLAVYGTVTKTWLEYVLENTRRQAALGGAEPASIDSLLRDEAKASHYLYTLNMTPEQTLAEHPELERWFRDSLVEMKYTSGLHYRFVQQLAAKNTAQAWQNFDGYALAAWGAAEFISGQDDHRLIAEFVNARHPGHGRFEVVEQSDHGFYRAQDAKDSFAHWGRPGREVNPAFANLLAEWAREVVAAEGAR